MYELNQQNIAASHGVLMNSNGGVYQHGKSYGKDTKLLVATKYLKHNARLGGLRPCSDGGCRRVPHWEVFCLKNRT